MNNPLIIWFNKDINSLDLITALKRILNIRVALLDLETQAEFPDPVNVDCFVEIRKLITKDFYFYVVINAKMELAKNNLEIIKELSFNLNYEILSHVSFIFPGSPKKQDPFVYCLITPKGELFEVEEVTENLPEGYGVILTDYRKKILY